jgi:signal transduction histidine kinase
MNPQRSIESVIRRTASQPFRFKFSVVYIAITGAVAYLNGVEKCGANFPVNPATGIGGILLALLALEWYEYSRYDKNPSARAKSILLAARILLIEGMVTFDCNGIALLLFPMIPYYAHFAFGEAASASLSVVYIMLVFWRTGFSESFFRVDMGTESNLLAFTFVMLFIPLIANIIRRDDESRLKTERLLTDLEISHLKLQAYTEQVADLAAAEERNRLARDIHDSLGHYLTAIGIQLEKALAYQKRNPEEATQSIVEAKQAAADALRDVRLSVGTLRSAENNFSLAASVEKIIEGIRSENLQIEFSAQGSEADYPRSALMALYRAAQEGLTNVQKHSQASAASLKISLGKNEARMVLRDNGQGFDPEALEKIPQSPSFGLRGIRERLELIRGSMSLHSQPQQGVELIVVIPRATFAPDNSTKGETK